MTHTGPLTSRLIFTDDGDIIMQGDPAELLKWNQIEQQAHPFIVLALRVLELEKRVRDLEAKEAAQ